MILKMDTISAWGRDGGDLIPIIDDPTNPNDSTDFIDIG